MKSGSERIVAERQRQIEKEGWTSAHDDGHGAGELAMAAACYAAPKMIYSRETVANGLVFVDPWPWDWEHDARPYNGNVLLEPTREQRIRLLEKAGALCAAEIDRLLRTNS